MMYNFDGPNRTIILDSGVTSFDVDDLYSRWKEWLKIADNSKFLPAFDNSVGGNPLGGSTSLGAYYFLINGWVIRPQEANHSLTVNGNLFPVPAGFSMFTPTLGNFQITINLVTSSLTQAISTNGATSAWSEAEKDEIISDVKLARDHARASNAQTQGM